MKKRKARTYYSIITVLLLICMAGFIVQDTEQDLDDWVVPDRFKHMDNPVEADNQSLRIGQSLYRRNCRSCHGAEGSGDGREAADLETTLRDFGSEEVQNQTDGELFFKTSEGRNEMPGFKADLIEEDIWNIINFIRTLKEE